MALAIEPFDYASSKIDADELIEEFGQTLFIRQVVNSGPAHNPIRTNIDHPVKAAVVEYDTREIDGTRISRSDRKALVAIGALEIVPDNSMKMVISGKAFPIVHVGALNPAGTPVFYEIQVRM